MFNLLRSEWYKLCRNRSFRLLLTLLFLSAVAYVLINAFDNDDGGAVNSTTGLELLTSAMSGNNYIIKIGLCVLAGFFISSEYSAGTIKRAVASGYSRRTYMTAKLLVFIGGSILTAFVFPVVNFVLGSLIFGIGDLPPGVSTMAYLLKSAAMTFTLAASFAAVTGSIATLLTDSGKTIGTAFIFYFFADGLYMMIAKFAPFVNTLYDYSIFNYINRYQDPLLSDTVFGQSVYIPLLVAIAFIGIGTAVFSRKEIK